MDERPVLISTRQLPPALLVKAADAGIRLINLSFIDTFPLEDIDTTSEVEALFQLSATLVFTSQEAVTALAAHQTDTIPDWTIYCTEPATAALVKKHFGETVIAGTAENAEALAELIIGNEEPDDIYFICGTRHRPELPQLLSKAGFNLTTIEVYETQAVHHQVDSAFAGVIFFSPSAVTSFFHNNKMPAQAIAFAIGDTTATAIRTHCSNRILIADTPDKERLLDLAMEILTT